MKNKKTCPTGFTLIELIVTVAISGILITVLFANFGSFNKSKRLSEATDDFVADLRSANTKGFAGDKACASGETWGGWEARYSSATQYQIRPICDTAAAWTTYELANGVQFNENWGPFSFYTLDEGISDQTDIDLVLDSLDLTVTIATTGAIYVQN